MRNSFSQSKESTHFVNSLTGFLVVAAGAGFVRLGAIPVVLAGLLAWPAAKWIAKLLEAKFRARALLFLLSIVLVAVTLLLSTVAGLLASKTIPQNHAQPETADPSERNGSLAANELVKFANESNKNNPTRISENVELNRIDAGPGLVLTYNVRILVGGVPFTDSDLNEIKIEAIREACSSFRLGLNAGVTYVMAYSNLQGHNLLTVPITIEDCGTAP
jgi:predicted PurR-regulated permease PerM